MVSNNSPTSVALPEVPRLLDRVRARLRLKHYSLRTETAYVGWIRRFILFHGKRHPGAMGETEAEAFLTALAVVRNASASMQIGFGRALRLTFARDPGQTTII